MDKDEYYFSIDVRDVLQRQKDKSYSTLGEAFEDYFHDCYHLSDDESTVLAWDDPRHPDHPDYESPPDFD